MPANPADITEPGFELLDAAPNYVGADSVPGTQSWGHAQLNRDATSELVNSDSYTPSSVYIVPNVLAATNEPQNPADDFGPRHTDNVYDFSDPDTTPAKPLTDSTSLLLPDGESQLKSTGSEPSVNPDLDEIVVTVPSVVEEVDDDYVWKPYVVHEAGVYKGPYRTVILGRKDIADLIEVTPASPGVSAAVNINGEIHNLEGDFELLDDQFERLVISGQGGGDTITSSKVSVIAITGEGNDTIDLGDGTLQQNYVFSGSGQDKIRGPLTRLRSSHA